MTRRTKILFIFARHGSETSTRFGGFAKRLQKNGGLEYATADHVALEDLIFHVKDEKNARVFDPVRGIDLANYAFVYFKSWQAYPRLAASAALYLEAMGIPYEDMQVRHEYIAKTPNIMHMWQKNISVPESIWGSCVAMSTYLESHRVPYPAVIKSVVGQKGHDNYLVRNTKQATRILQDAKDEMVFQAFVPNDGDYRIGVYGHVARWAIYRRSGGRSHLNNTSNGGTAELLDIAQVPSDVRHLAERAAGACELAISGVDVMCDKYTHKSYILEANQGSQIVTGVFTGSNIRAFDDGLKSLVQHRYARNLRSRRPVIGRTVSVGLNVLGYDNTITAKIDTGAYRSSLHAENIHKGVDDTGEYVSYELPIPHSLERTTIKTYEFTRARIKNSFGVKEDRFVVPVSICILGKAYETEVSLTSRSLQKYPVLLGRKLLRGNFLVNVELSALGE